MARAGLTPGAHDVARPVPLAVELEGTLVQTSLTIESLFVLAKQHPLGLLSVPIWLTHGLGALKHRLARDAMPDVASLPYDRALLADLQARKREGGRLVLTTDADRHIAEAIARHIGLFDAVLASDGASELSPARKRDRLVAEFGARGFDYVGSRGRDRPVWAAARKAVLVRPELGLRASLTGLTEVERVLGDRPSHGSLYLQALRPHQWLKNGLVLVPMIADHRLADPELWLQGLVAFVAFSLFAASTYLLNDLIDLPRDRRHPHKRDRALASGRLPLAHAALLIPLLLVASAAVGLLLPTAFLGVLGLYFALTLAYSLRLKDVVILDVLALAGLHALRVLAGAAALSIPPSAWLLAFCVFLFFSLAMIKRYAELMIMRALDGTAAHARAYRLEDSELLAALGGASGYLAVLVLALYISAGEGHNLYGWDRSQLLWLICVLLLYWISYMWLMAHRARMLDDPLVFALRDRVSRVLIALMGVVVILATFP